MIYNKKLIKESFLISDNSQLYFNCNNNTYRINLGVL